MVFIKMRNAPPPTPAISAGGLNAILKIKEKLLPIAGRFARRMSPAADT